MISPITIPSFPHNRIECRLDTNQQRTLIIFYSATSKKSFRLELNNLAERFFYLGFEVFTFDYRSNAPGERFTDFGLSDRIEDAVQMIKYAKRIGTGRLSLFTFGMGAHVALQAIANMPEDQRALEYLFLLAPMAYPPEATTPEIKFGPQFNHLIHRTDAYRDSLIFKSAKCIDADTLVLSYDADSHTRRSAANLYHACLGRNQTTNRRKAFACLKGNHDRALTNSEKMLGFVREISKFMTAAER